MPGPARGDPQLIHYCVTSNVYRLLYIVPEGHLKTGRDVLDVTAYHWGFTHPGRFARAYRDRFGEPPPTH